MKVGLLGRGFVNIYVKDDLIFQPGIQYVRKGLRQDAGYGGRYFNQPFTYFEFPLNVLSKSQNKKKPFYLGAGLSPAFRSKRYQYGSSIKSFDLGINVLAGYIFPLGFSVNLGYTHGIINAAANRDYLKRIHNRNFSATVGYEF